MDRDFQPRKLEGAEGGGKGEMPGKAERGSSEHCVGDACRVNGERR